MIKTPGTSTSRWREARRRSAREAIVEAAWALVAEEGLAGLSLRDLARRAGITTPTVYAYFGSKNAIYDAMFGQAAAELADTMAAPYDGQDPRELLVAGVQRFFDFCTSNLPRYQLLFQRTLPGFDPSPRSYAPAVRALAGAREALARNGKTGGGGRVAVTNGLHVGSQAIEEKMHSGFGRNLAVALKMAAFHIHDHKIGGRHHAFIDTGRSSENAVGVEAD